MVEQVVGPYTGGVCPNGVGPRLLAIRAAKAPVGDFPFLAVLIDVADEHPAAVARARAQTLEASIVRLDIVLMFLGWFFDGRVRGCARILCGHWDVPPLAWRSRFALDGAGAFALSDYKTIIPYLSHFFTK